jgi:hypothetical protein
LLAPLPAALDLDETQLIDWRARWGMATRRAPVTFDEALAGAKTFLDPVLANEMADAHWSADGRRWIAGEAG